MEVGLFFYIDGRFSFHGCELERAQDYGDFLIYPESHWAVWEMMYKSKYNVDYDYFPRGRVAYRKSDESFLIFYDRCIDNIGELVGNYVGYMVYLGLDEHYQCHMCNEGYVV